MQWPHLAVDVLPLLTTISPLIGVATILLMWRWSTSLVWPMAVSNATITLLLTATTVWLLPFEPETPVTSRTRGEPGITWLAESRVAGDQPSTTTPRGFNLRLAFGHEGLSAWPALLLSLTVWGVLWCPGRIEASLFPAYCLGLMSSQAFLLAAVYSTDAVACLIFVELAAVPLYLLIGMSGDEGRRTIAGNWWLWQFLGCSTSLLGVTLLAVSQPWMISDLVIHRGAIQFDESMLAENLRQALARSETALHVWNDLGQWGAALVMAAFLIRLPVFPFHEWYRAVLFTAPCGIAAVIAVAFPAIAFSSWIRLGSPVFGQSNNVLAGILAMLAMLGALQSSLTALSQSDVKRLVASMSCAMLCLACLGLSFQTRDGHRGAWLLILAQSLAVPLGMLLVQILESRCGTCDLDQLPALKTTSPRLASALALLFLAWAGIPAASGFSALYLEHSNPVGAKLWLILGESAALIALASASIRIFARLMTSSSTAASPPVNDVPVVDLSSSEAVVLSPFVTLLVLLNVAPEVILNVCEGVFRSKG